MGEEKVLTAPRREVREHEGHEPEPSVTMIDCHSITTCAGFRLEKSSTHPGTHTADRSGSPGNGCHHGDQERATRVREPQTWPNALQLEAIRADQRSDSQGTRVAAFNRVHLQTT